MLLRPEFERELRERLDEPRLDEPPDVERLRPVLDDERRRVVDEPFDDELAIVLMN